MSKPKEIVLTGGPCAGKTTGLSHLQSWLLDRGFRPLMIPEVATMIIGGGVQDIGKIASENFKLYLAIQKSMLKMQLGLRKQFLNLAGNFTEQVVMVYDRGPMDGKAYIPHQYFDAILAEEKLQLNEVRDVYDAVIHLVTAADGAERYYTTANNQARMETAEEARKLDLKTQDAWNGHPHMRVIDNSTGFDLKIKRLISATARSLGIPVPLEIERKYLVSNFDFSTIESQVQVVGINQVYIHHPVDGMARIRKRHATDGSATYYYTIKTASGSALVRYEREERISATEYLNLESFREPRRISIAKRRYCFIWHSQYFELDVFVSPAGLTLLEIELTEENDKVELPPFINVVREVTDDPQYSNYNLAKKI